MALHVLYFENADGRVSLPPTSETAELMARHPKYKKSQLKEANTLPEIDRLQTRLHRQAQEELQVAEFNDETMWRERRKQIYDNLYQRLISAGTDEYEKEFLRHYLQLREEKRQKYHARFVCDRAYFTAREFDQSGRNALDHLMPEGER